MPSQVKVNPHHIYLFEMNQEQLRNYALKLLSQRDNNWSNTHKLEKKLDSLLKTNDRLSVLASRLYNQISNHRKYVDAKKKLGALREVCMKKYYSEPEWAETQMAQEIKKILSKKAQVASPEVSE